MPSATSNPVIPVVIPLKNKLPAPVFRIDPPLIVFTVKLCLSPTLNVLEPESRVVEAMSSVIVELELAVVTTAPFVRVNVPDVIRNAFVWPVVPLFVKVNSSIDTVPTLLVEGLAAAVPPKYIENVPEVVGAAPVDQFAAVFQFVPEVPNQVVIVPAEAVLAATMPMSVKSVRRRTLAYILMT